MVGRTFVDMGSRRVNTMHETTRQRPLGWRQILAFAGVLTMMLAVPLAALAEEATPQPPSQTKTPKPTHFHDNTQTRHIGGATYRVYGYQEGLVGYTTANGHVIQPEDHFVALPCFCVLSSKGG